MAPAWVPSVGPTIHAPLNNNETLGFELDTWLSGPVQGLSGSLVNDFHSRKVVLQRAGKPVLSFSAVGRNVDMMAGAGVAILGHEVMLGIKATHS